MFVVVVGGSLYCIDVLVISIDLSVALSPFALVVSALVVWV